MGTIAAILLCTFVVTHWLLPDRGTLHEVQPGESCWSIAQEYGTTAQDIMTINGHVGEDCRFLQIGRTIIVPLEPLRGGEPDRSTRWDPPEGVEHDVVLPWWYFGRGTFELDRFVYPQSHSFPVERSCT